MGKQGFTTPGGDGGATTSSAFERGSARLAADHDIAATGGLGDYEDIAVSVTLPVAGVYELKAFVTGATSGDDQSLRAIIVDAANNQVSEVGLVTGAQNNAAAENFGTSGSTLIVAEITTTTANEVFHLRASQSNNTATGVINAGSTLFFDQKPITLTVPAANIPIEVSRVSEMTSANEAVALGLLEVRVVDAGTGNGAQTEIRVSSGTASLTNFEGSYLLQNGGGANSVKTSMALTTAWQTLWDDNSLNLGTASDQEFATFTYNGIKHKVVTNIGVAYAFNEIIIERTEQQSVLDTDSIPVTDNTATGEFIVGTKHEQNGIGTSSNTPTPTTITFPTEMADANYAISVTPKANAGAAYAVSYDNVTTTSMQVYITTIAGAYVATEFRWEIKGLKA